MWGISQQTPHWADRLELTSEIFLPNASLTMMYVALVISIVDPSYTRHEFQQSGCTGTFVRENLLVTSASCVIHSGSEYPNPKDVMVLTRYSGSPLIVTRIFIHPDYTKEGEDYNIAIIEVDHKNTNFTSFPKLPNKHLNFKSIVKTCKLAGYGRLESLNKRHFLVVDLRESMAKEFECKTKSDHRVCLHFNDIQPCNGDVGSPIICGDKFYAMFSPSVAMYPMGCMERYVLSFIALHSVLEWVGGVVNAPRISMEWMNNPLYILLLCGAVLTVIGLIYWVIMEWLQRKLGPLDTLDPDGQGDGDDDSEWAKIST